MTLKGIIRRLRPDHLAGQITLLILASITIFQTIVMVTFHVLDVEGRRHIVDQSDFVTSVILALDAADVPARGRLLAEFTHAAPYADIAIHDDRPAAAPVNDQVFRSEIRRVNAGLWHNAAAFAASAPTNETPGVIAVALRKGGYALISISQHRKPSRSVWRWLWQTDPSTPFLLTPWALSALLFFMSTTILVIWASNGIVAPLIKLARHAERFPNEMDCEGSLAERGPREIRELTRSINIMQARIRTMIAARTHVLAAVSHDLRTIITRLNLRTEFISDETLKIKMSRDIGLMDAMLHKNLQHLRANEDEKSDHSLIDLDSVLQTVADQFCDTGHDVIYRGGQRQMIYGSITEMQRVFTNLVENAVHHAKLVEISVEEPSPGQIQVDIADNGPGIPDENKTNAFEPFVRGQRGRTLDEHSGFGLGLSIVRSLVESHGGSVQLLDREPHGLIARVALPRAFATEEELSPTMAEPP